MYRSGRNVRDDPKRTQNIHRLSGQTMCGRLYRGIVGYDVFFRFIHTSFYHVLYLPLYNVRKYRSVGERFSVVEFSLTAIIK